MEKRFDELKVGEAFEYVDYCGNLNKCIKLPTNLTTKFKGVDFLVNALNSDGNLLLVPDSARIE